jgi:hypothetical protein
MIEVVVNNMTGRDQMTTDIFMPSLAIWFWTTVRQKAAVSVVNDRYLAEIFDRKTGKRTYMQNAPSLSEAKALVFNNITERN